MSANEPIDAVLDAVAEALSDQPASPSRIARKASTADAKISTTDAHAALRWLVEHQMAVAVGNGAWANYRERRFGERT
jgi:hypothetical protein